MKRGIGIAVLAALALGYSAKAQETNVNVVVNQDTTLTWNWAEQHRLQLPQVAGVTISGTYSNVYENGAVAEGFDAYHDKNTVVKLDYELAPHKTFGGWTGVPAGKENEKPLELSLDGPMTLGATINDKLYTLTVISAKGGNPRPGTTNVIYGTTVEQTVDTISTQGAPVGTRYKVRGHTITP